MISRNEAIFLPAIEEAAILGAASYYRYLSRTKKGCEIIEVLEITREDSDYRLRISKNPFSVDAVTFRIMESEYDQRHVYIYAHDRDNHFLYVRIAKDRDDPLTGVSAGQIQVVSDLKFLVRRVQSWYEMNEDTLGFPCPSPAYQFSDFIQTDLSENQKKAVREVLSYAPTYVWGAPGTGKTRFVLAECLLQYCLSGQQVVVIAPTNNAIEQVLYGVLEKLKAHQIPLVDVIRLGTPSLKFAVDYGEICEVQGVEKRLMELAAQILFYKDLLAFRGFLKRLRYSELEILPTFSKIKQSLMEMKNASTRLEDANTALSQAERLVRSCNALHLSATRSFTEQGRRMQTLAYRVGKAFSSSFELSGKEKLMELEALADSAAAKKADAANKLLLAFSERESARTELAMLCSSTDTQIKDLALMLASIDGFKGIMEKLTYTTIDFCESRLVEKIAEGHSYRINMMEKYTAYDEINDEQIELRISEIEEQYRFIKEQTTDARLARVKIVAATIDTFLFRFNPNASGLSSLPILFRHIFLDEAGYCPLVKALVLFGFKRPVTLFGDHMQLPPVCEADDDKLELVENKNAFLFAQSALFVEDAFLSEHSMDALLSQYLHSGIPSFLGMRKSDLRQTYRFGNTLAAILDKHVYGNGFCSANPDSPFTIEVLDAPRKPGDQNRENTAEAEIIKERLPFIGTDDYAILTPYRNQVRLLTRTLTKAHREQRILTIHASQGREWDTIFLSVVDTGDMYFTNTKRTDIGGLQVINTAVSRAKKRIIVVCDTAFWRLQEGQLIYELIMQDSLH